MRAVHWLRSRQEERELAYWLSFVAYEHRDRSLSNRIYLLYLLLFFTVWLFITLALFASSAGDLLGLFNAVDPVHAALLLEVLALGVWSLFSLRQALRRSPVVFSEQDALLLCQTPVSRRAVVTRWFVMPWLKNAVPFWLLTIALGFTIAEVTMPGLMGSNRLPEYAGFGLRAWLAVLPLHIGLFALLWTAGVSRLQQKRESRLIAWVVLSAAVLFFAFVLMYLLALPLPALWNRIAQALIAPMAYGFSGGWAQLGSWLFAFAAFSWLAGISDWFSLARAAQETSEVEAVSTAIRYGFTDYAEKLQTQRRLGVRRAPTQIPAIPGAGVLIWKDMLQSRRTFRLLAVLPWLIMFTAMLFLPLLPDLSSRAFVLVFWVVQVGRATVIRIRSDLALWPLIRQLPIPHRKFVLADLAPALLLSLVVSLAGLALGGAIFSYAGLSLALLIPGMVVSTAGMAALDIIRRSRTDLLLAGYAPELGASGVFTAILVAAIPLAIQLFVPAWFGLLLSVLASATFGLFALFLVAYAYRKIETF